MLWVMFNCRHTFGFSGEQGKLAQLACIDSQTIVYAIGCGLHRYRCMLHTITNPAHFTMIYMLIIIQVERERERESLWLLFAGLALPFLVGFHSNPSCWYSTWQLCMFAFSCHSLTLGRFSIQFLSHQLDLTMCFCNFCSGRNHCAVPIAMPEESVEVREEVP
jgi:hypothetical protein